MKGKFTLEYVKKIFEEEGCELLSEEYVNARTPMKYRCVCGTESYTRLYNFRIGKRCKACGIKKASEMRRTPYDEVFNHFKEEGCLLLTKEYINSKQKLTYICNCGRESKITYPDFKIGVRCMKCGHEKISGENSPHYKPHLSEEHRRIGRNDVLVRRWRTSVFERDNYTCAGCGVRGNGVLNAHHLFSYDKYKTMRYEKLNGVTLCEECHKDFHNEYGYGNNTMNEWIEWFVERVGVNYDDYKR